MSEHLQPTTISGHEIKEENNIIFDLIGKDEPDRRAEFTKYDVTNDPEVEAEINQYIKTGDINQLIGTNDASIVAGYLSSFNTLLVQNGAIPYNSLITESLIKDQDYPEESKEVPIHNSRYEQISKLKHKLQNTEVINIFDNSYAIHEPKYQLFEYLLINSRKFSIFMDVLQELSITEIDNQYVGDLHNPITGKPNIIAIDANNQEVRINFRKDN